MRPDHEEWIEQAEDGMVRDFLLAVFDNDPKNPLNPETVLQRKAK